MQAEAYSILHYETAARYYRAGQIKPAQAQLQAAMSRCPSPDPQWLLEWLAGSALDSRTPDPQQFLALVFDNLPPAAVTLRLLRRRAYGRYHTGAAFLEYRNHRPKNIRRHILPALKGDPAIIRNRGFIRLAIQALIG
jgi:hypothetical protein